MAGEVVIYSKTQCPYCDQAKAMLKQRGVAYREVMVVADDQANGTDKVSREQLLEVAPKARSVPQIFINGNLIGGFTELQKYFLYRDVIGA